MARGTRNPPPRPKPAAEATPAAAVPFQVWKAEVVLALVKVHERAMTVTRDDGFWTRLYVRGLDPEQAATAAAREYDATHRPDWVKRRS
jgi:hypothetical protein